ncbi:MAG: VWA domain-containing protein [Planctomycetota bacterium]|nr:VWA domain-containing protein [Planctomycetota bacterium]
MTFLEPSAFYLLALLAVIGLSYLLRMPRRRLRVPDAGVARRVLAETRRARPRKRTLISLALQLALFALLLLAAAKPYGSGTSDEPARRLVVLLDVSASMGADDEAEYRELDETEPEPEPGRTRFARAVEAVRGLVRDLKHEDRLMLVAVGRTADVVFNFEQDTLALDRWLAEAAPSGEATSFREAAELAVSVSRSTPGCEVYVVTDGAAHPDDFEPLAQVAEGGGRLYFVPVGAEGAGNLGITDFRVRKNLDSPGDYEAFVAVANTFGEPKTVTINLAQDGKVIDAAAGVAVPAGGRAVHVFREKLYVGGLLEASLRIVDAFGADNRAMEVLTPKRRLRVLLVSDEAGEDTFLKRAIGSNPTALKGVFMTPAEYREKIAPKPEVLQGQLDAIVFDRWAPAAAAEVPRLHLLCIDCTPPALPAELGAEFEQPLIRTWDKGHPLMTYLNLRDVFLDKARELNLRPVAAGSQPIERVAELVHKPLIVAWETEAGGGEASESRGQLQRIVAVAMDPSKSDIAYRKELPLLLWNCFEWFQTHAEPPTQARPGEVFSLDAVGAPEAGTVQVKGPGDLAETVAIDAQSRRAVFGSTKRPGVYRYALGDEQGAFVVNVGAPEESDVRRRAGVLEQAETVEAETLAGARWGRAQLLALPFAGRGRARRVRSHRVPPADLLLMETFNRIEILQPQAFLLLLVLLPVVAWAAWFSFDPMRRARKGAGQRRAHPARWPDRGRAGAHAGGARHGRHEALRDRAAGRLRERAR